MTATKAQQLAKEIDNARCKGNWQSILELARRYKKYALDGGVLEQTVLAEVALAQLEPIDNEPSFANDSPGNVTTRIQFNPGQVKTIQEQLNTILQSSPQPNQGPLIEFAKIVLARSYYLSGDYQTTLDIVEQLSFSKDEVSAGYGFILFLQARGIKAISLEMLERVEDALHSYDGAVSLIKNVLLLPSPLDRVLVDWAEEILYHGCLLALQTQLLSTEATMTMLRTYYKLTSSQEANWRTDKRVVVIRHMIAYFSDRFRHRDFVPNLELLGSNGISSEGDGHNGDIHLVFASELVHLYTVYEKLLYIIAPFPSAGNTNTPVLRFIDQLAGDLDLIGDSTNDLRGFIDVLHRTSEVSFNSPLILRHLFFALVRLGEYEEAEHALRAYLLLVGLIDQAWVESRHNGKALVVDARGNFVPLPRVVLPSKTDGLCRRENESVTNIYSVLLTAIVLYCKELGQGVEAVEIAEIAKQLLPKLESSEESEESEASDNDQQNLVSQIYQAAGVAYGVLGTQTVDPEVRSEFHEKALQHLQTAVESNATSWEAIYHLALQQAEMHDIQQASQSILRSIELNPSHTPSWHLLTLLRSCPILEQDHGQVLRICDAGLQKSSEAMVENHPRSRLGARVSWEPEDQTEQQLLMQTTRVILVDVHDGPEAALESQMRLFTSIGKASAFHSTDSGSPSASAWNEPSSYQPPGLVVSGSLGNLSDIHTIEQRRRGRSVSSSVVGSQQTVSTMLASRSHDNVHVNGDVVRPSPSVQSQSTNCLGMVSPTGPSSDSEHPSQPQPHHRHHYLHGLHLFSRKAKKEEDSPIKFTSSAERVDGRSPLLTVSTASLPTGVTTTYVSGVKTLLQPSSVPRRPTTRSRLWEQRSRRLRSNMWLLSADAFLRLGNFEECLKAIEEAEKENWTSNAEVWCLLGRLRMAEHQTDQAIAAFQKGLMVDPSNVDCHVWLARTHMEQGELDMAESLLDTVTKGKGWNCAEAWFYLGAVYEQTERVEQTKHCYFYALDLESTQPIRPFSILPRCV